MSPHVLNPLLVRLPGPTLSTEKHYTKNGRSPANHSLSSRPAFSRIPTLIHEISGQARFCMRFTKSFAKPNCQPFFNRCRQVSTISITLNATSSYPMHSDRWIALIGKQSAIAPLRLTPCSPTPSKPQPIPQLHQQNQSEHPKPVPHRPLSYRPKTAHHHA